MYVHQQSEPDTKKGSEIDDEYKSDDNTDILRHVTEVVIVIDAPRLHILHYTMIT